MRSGRSAAQKPAGGPRPEGDDAVGAWGEKTMYGRRTMGVIRSTVWVGPDGVVRRHWPRVADAARHPAEVLEAIRSQRAGAACG